MAALLLPLACADDPCPSGLSDLCVGSWKDIAWNRRIEQAVAVRSPEGELLVSVRSEPARLTILRAETSSEIALPGFATALAAVDFDGDAIDELAVAFADPSEIVVYDLGREPTLERRVTVPYDTVPRDLIATDLDGDGADELLCADGGGGSISTINGAGERRRYAAGEAPFRLIAGELSGDGALDVATLDFVSGDLVVLHGDGAGGLEAASSHPLTPGSDRLSAGDINGDGRLDLGVVGLGAEAWLFLGEDGGPLSEPFTIDADALEEPLLLVEPGTRGLGAVGYVREGELIAELVDGSGALAGGRARLRLAPYDDIVSLGDGSYVSSSIPGVARVRSIEGPVPIERSRYAVATPSQTGSIALAAGDLDGDGDVDLVAAREAIWPLLSDGGGSFVAGESLASEPFDTMVLGDVDGDGDADLVARRGTELVVARGGGDGSFAHLDGSIQVAEDAALHMLDRSGGSCVVAFVGARLGVDASIEVFDFVDDGPLAPMPTPSLALVEPTRAAVGDIDGDGDGDLLLLGRDGPDSAAPWAIQALLADTSGLTAGPMHRLEGLDPGTYVLGLTVAEAVDDALAEALALTAKAVHRVVDPAGPTPTQASDAVAIPGNTRRVLVAEVDGDGHRDLVLLGNNARDVGFVYGGPAGFASSAPFRVQAPVVRAVVDVNGDGRVDFIGAENDEVSVLINETHVSPQIVDNRELPSRMNLETSADLDGDGENELILTNLGSVGVLVEPLSEAPQLHTWIGGVSFVDVADIDGDGGAEIIVRSFNNARELWTLRWDGARLLREEAPWISALFTDTGPAWLALRDLDGDSHLDLAAIEGDRLVIAYGAPGGDRWPTFTALEVIAEGVRGPLRIGDANGDGLAEVVVSAWLSYEEVQELRVAVANGRSWTVREIPGADAVIRPEADLIVLHEDALYRRPICGDRVAPAMRLAELASATGLHIAGVGDVDGDGQSDLLTADLLEGTLWLGRSEALVEEGGVTLRDFPLILDVDGDGTAELLRDRGGKWAVYMPEGGRS